MRGPLLGKKKRNEEKGSRPGLGPLWKYELGWRDGRVLLALGRAPTLEGDCSPTNTLWEGPKSGEVLDPLLLGHRD